VNDLRGRGKGKEKDRTIVVRRVRVLERGGDGGRSELALTCKKSGKRPGLGTQRPREGFSTCWGGIPTEN